MKFIIILLFVIYTSIVPAANDRSDLKGRGILLDHPNTNCVTIDPEVEFGHGITIACGVYILGKSRIGNGCKIGPFTTIKNCILEDNVTVHSNSVLEGSTVRSKAEVGPFAHISEGSDIQEKAVIGNFVEVKRSTIGQGSKAKHLSYLGDTQTGKEVNIGAGTITCNYNGVSKHKTIIGDNAFIGSNSTIVAPVIIGSKAMTGAGSTITKDVPAESLAIARSQQTNKDGYAPKILAQYREEKTQD